MNQDNSRNYGKRIYTVPLHHSLERKPLTENFNVNGYVFSWIGKFNNENSYFGTITSSRIAN